MYSDPDYAEFVKWFEEVPVKQDADMDAMGARDRWDLLKMWTTQTKELFSKPDQQQVLGGGRTTYKQAVQQIGLWRLVASGRRPERPHTLLEQIALQLKAQHDGILTADLLRLELEKRAQVTSVAAATGTGGPTT